ANGIINTSKVTSGANLHCIITNTFVQPPTTRNLSVHVTLANVSSTIKSLDMNVTLIGNKLHALAWQAKHLNRPHDGQHANFMFKSVPPQTTGFLVCATAFPSTANNGCIEYPIPHS